VSSYVLYSNLSIPMIRWCGQQLAVPCSLAACTHHFLCRSGPSKHFFVSRKIWKASLSYCHSIIPAWYQSRRLCTTVRTVQYQYLQPGGTTGILICIIPLSYQHWTRVPRVRNNQQRTEHEKEAKIRTHNYCHEKSSSHATFRSVSIIFQRNLNSLKANSYSTSASSV